MDNKDLREKLIEAAQRIDRRNMQTNNGGNFSARCDCGIMLVKPTDISFTEAKAENLVYSDFNGCGIGEGLKPSKESILHGLIYKEMPEVGAIMHCHSPWATAWAESMLPLEYSTYHSGLKLGCCVPVFDTGGYAVPVDKAEIIVKDLKEKYPGAKAFLLRKHGLMAMGKDILDAVNVAELVEETAMIAMLSRICAFSGSSV